MAFVLACPTPAFARSFASRASEPAISLSEHEVESQPEQLAAKAPANPLRLWYDEPSSAFRGEDEQDRRTWEKRTLPIGNGDMGANIYGEIGTEHLTFNEKTLWTGGPSKKRPHYQGGNLDAKGKHGDTLKRIQALFAAGKTAEASALCDELVGSRDGYGSFQPWGDIYIKHIDLDPAHVQGFMRDLNLSEGIAHVSFESADTAYTREFFMSHPAKALVGHLESKRAGNLNLEISFPSKQGGTTYAEGNTLRLAGEVSDNQLRYDSILTIDTAGSGSVQAAGDKLIISGARELTFTLVAATDYKNEYPTYRTGETPEALAERVNAAAAGANPANYQELRAAHIADHTALMGRVALDLGSFGAVSKRPTDEFLRAYNEGTASDAERRQLEVMLFQYGRYLTLGSSREDSQLPSNLQGVWNDNVNPIWASDYHMNVNLQMNYWPVYSTNLAECARPLISYVDSLRKPGRVTASVYAGIATPEGDEAGRGFMAHTQNTPFGWTCPGWQFSWGWSPAAVPWILQNTYDAWRYSGDIEQLKTDIYPALREQALLYSRLLVKGVDGTYSIVPSYSPEHGPRTAGNTYEQTLAWQLLHDALEAGKLLGEDASVMADWQDKFDHLRTPIEIGSDGQIKEWYIEDAYNKDASGKPIPDSQGFGHRHLSHMLGLFPGTLISSDTPAWFEAAKKSMNLRTDSSTGWGMGQRINTWAHLHDGKRAHKLIGDLLQSGIYANLWDTHPPFQIDGNFGATSGIAEMLLQSSNGYIDLLPALPKAWQTGSVSGLVARGNVVVDMDWSAGALTEAKFLPRSGGELVVQVPNAALAVVTNASAEPVEIRAISQDRIAFDTVAGETYCLSMIPAIDQAPVPSGGMALKSTDNRVDLSWEAVAKPGAVYTVSRRVGEGSWVPIATELVEPSYTDLEAFDALGALTYRVSARSTGRESEPTEPIAVQDLRAMTGIIDDQDPRVIYTGAWGNWNVASDGNSGGTIKYLNQPTGSETASLLFYGTGIELITARNSDRGTLEITIDNKVAETVDTYAASSERQKTVFSQTDLQRGVHRIVVRATGEKKQGSSAKVELDAFRILDRDAVPISNISLSTAHGITTVAKPDSNLSMQAVITPEHASKQALAWSVKTLSGTAQGSIINTGLLSVRGQSGVLRVYAHATDGSGVSGSCDITVSQPGEVARPVDDTKNGALNRDGLTWDAGWSPYFGEASKHFGGSKTEVTGVGKRVRLSFHGTGVRVFAQKHENFSAFDVDIDGQSFGQASLAGSSTGDPQSLIFEKTGLENTDHVLTLTVAERAGRQKANIDYFEILAPSTIVDKSQLQEGIEAGAALYADEYSPSSWARFEQAYKQAARTMNDDRSTEQDVAQALSALTSTTDELEPQPVPVPEFAPDAALRVAAIEPHAFAVRWDAVPGASAYIVCASAEGQPTKEMKVAEPFARFVDLAPDTHYAISVFACNRVDGVSERSLETTATTLQEMQEAQVVPPTGIAIEPTEDEGTVRVTWRAGSARSAEALSYRLYVNGKERARVRVPEATLSDLERNHAYHVRLVVEDGQGAYSLPAAFYFIYAGPKKPIDPNSGSEIDSNTSDEGEISDTEKDPGSSSSSDTTTDEDQKPGASNPGGQGEHTTTGTSNHGEQHRQTSAAQKNGTRLPRTADHASSLIRVLLLAGAVCVAAWLISYRRAERR
ncbi:glycoside hydrolase N-terminal domain-containing protein [Collinsella sp. AGMB00827]|uniref:Glycoside hydrolase N-terminal domain-containing protein n=1 Tax=Collinsella ureilytica TaxID=2869515 RepID=A0ABS7MKJ1_9ACTN|nr:glycoside hydrolase N-terminal domain-containing protein [Collinsella urealyticum]